MGMDHKVEVGRRLRLVQCLPEASVAADGVARPQGKVLSYGNAVADQVPLLEQLGSAFDEFEVVCVRLLSQPQLAVWVNGANVNAGFAEASHLLEQQSSRGVEIASATVKALIVQPHFMAHALDCPHHAGVAKIMPSAEVECGHPVNGLEQGGEEQSVRGILVDIATQEHEGLLRQPVGSLEEI